MKPPFLARGGSLATLGLILTATFVSGNDAPPNPRVAIDAAIRRGAYASAIAESERLAAHRSAHGDSSSAALEALDLVVRAHLASYPGGFPHTRSLAERAVFLHSSIDERATHEAGEALERLGMILVEAQEYGPARDAFERADAIHRGIDGDSTPSRAASLRGIGLVALREGRTAEGASRFERALALLEAAPALDTLETAVTLHALGTAAYWQSRLPDSRVFVERALALRREALGSDHPLVAASLAELGQVLWRSGEFEPASAAYEDALAILRRSLGPEHPRLCRVLTRLGNLETEQSDLAAATAHFAEAIRIAEHVFGPDHIEALTARRGQMFLLFNAGDHAGARDVAESVAKTMMRRVGAEHPDLAQAWLIMGASEAGLGDTTAAASHLRSAIELLSRVRGEDDMNLIEPLRQLGTIELRRNRTDRALELYERARGIAETKLGAHHPRVAYVLDELAQTHQRLGRSAEARRLFARALAIREGAFGPEHPEIANSLMKLARLDYDLGQRDSALQRALRSEAIGRSQLRLTSQALSEREALELAGARIYGLGLVVTLAADSVGLPPRELHAAWDALVRTRGVVLEEMALRHAPERTPGSDHRRALEALKAAKENLARLLVSGPAEDAAVFEEKVRAAREAADAADRALGHLCPDLADRSTVSLAEILEALPRDASLVSFVSYEHRLPPRAGESSRRERRLAAFVARGDARAIHAVPLGSENEIEGLISRWREALAADERTPASERAAREAGLAVRAHLWEPLAPFVEGTRHPYLVPDGPVSFVNLAALPSAEEGRYLVEDDLTFHRLTSERNLVTTRSAPRGDGLLAFGGANFDEGERESSAGARPIYRGPRPACRELREAHFEPLDHTEAEAREVAALYEGPRAGAGERAPLVRTGARATEEAFKRLAPGRRVVHLATHAFFLDEACLAPPAGSRGIGGLVPEESDAGASAPSSPLLRSGLVFAGVNARASARADEDDGVLTAEEITALDLSSVEWVVLSGCDTGLGAVVPDEGVDGLCRAFHVAGADIVIMSLWPVEDEAARAWVQALYESHLVDGRSAAEAVRAASITLLEARRAKGLPTHPGTWAAFVASGG